MLSLVRDFSEYDEIFRPEKKFKRINVSDDLLISPVSCDEVLAGRIICLS